MRRIKSTEWILQDLTGNMREFDAARRSFIDKIEVAILKRFSEFSNVGLIKATKIADIKSWPKEWNKLKGFFFSFHVILQIVTIAVHAKCLFIEFQLHNCVFIPPLSLVRGSILQSPCLFVHKKNLVTFFSASTGPNDLIFGM